MAEHKLTPKENYLRLYKKELPEWIPSWGMGMPMPNAPLISAGPRGRINKHQGYTFGSPGPPPEEWTNEWGVTYVANAEASWGGLPKPGNFILDDITKWDKVIKKPELIAPIDEIDWESIAKDTKKDIDLSTTGVLTGIGTGPFQFIVSFMGFSEALMALIEEPEACEEFFAWADEYFLPITEKAVEYWNPDMVYMADDSAAKYAPFVSPETYRKLLKPVYARHAKYATDRGLPVAFHNCGKAEAYCEDMFDFGVRYWDPAQTENDLLAVKEKFGGELVICGGFDFVPPPEGVDAITEEFTREYVRATFDKLAPGGSWAWMGMFMGPADDTKAPIINGWIQDEVATYGDHYYDKH